MADELVVDIDVVEHGVTAVLVRALIHHQRDRLDDLVRTNGRRGVGRVEAEACPPGCGSRLNAPGIATADGVVHTVLGLNDEVRSLDRAQAGLTYVEFKSVESDAPAS